MNDELDCKEVSRLISEGLDQTLPAASAQHRLAAQPAEALAAANAES